MRPPYNGLEIAVGHQSRQLLSFKATGRSSGEVNAVALSMPTHQDFWSNTPTCPLMIVEAATSAWVHSLVATWRKLEHFN